jgi:hypothetical protein
MVKRMVILCRSLLEFQVFSVIAKGWHHSAESAHDNIQHLVVTVDLDHIFNAVEIAD